MRVGNKTVSLAAVALLTVPLYSAISAEDDATYAWRRDVIDRISGNEIMITVEQLESFGTREFHTQSAWDAADHILGSLESLGMPAVLQAFEVGNITSVNVVGTLNADKADNGMYVIGAHYDSENGLVTNQSEAENVTAPGADDNASGVAAMLEMARVLTEEVDFSAAVRFVAFGAEELGYDNTGGTAGSDFFANTSREQGVNISGAFVMDMIGFSHTGTNISTVISDGESDWLYLSMATARTRYEIPLQIELIADDSIRYSDHSSFWDFDYHSVLVIEELDAETGRPVNPFYHTSDDTADELSEGQMVAVSKMILGALLDLTDQGEDSYTDSDIRTLTIVSILAIAVTAVVALHMYRRRGVY